MKSTTSIRLLKWVALVFGSLVVLMAIVLTLVYLITNKRMNQSFSVVSHPVAAPADSAALAYGKRLSQMRGCTDCHGENLAGRLMIDAPLVAKLYASNLTPGKGGIGKKYSDADWERSIRHAVAPDGKPLIFMPAQEFFYLSDGDLSALISYLKSLPPEDNELPASSIGPLARILFLAGQMPLVPAELIDNQAAHPDAPTPGVTVEYGRYLTLGCIGCHKPDFSGGPIPGAPPDWPPASNLTPSGNLKHWSESDFIQAMRTGIKPDGQPFSPQMPYQALNAMTDTELKAVWRFLQSLPSPSGAANGKLSLEQ